MFDSQFNKLMLSTPVNQVPPDHLDKVIYAFSKVLLRLGKDSLSKSEFDSLNVDDFYSGGYFAFMRMVKKHPNASVQEIIGFCLAEAQSTYNCL